MDRLRVVQTLLIGDTELSCNCSEKTISDINITMVALNPEDLKKYDLVVYSGSKGTKVIKSTYTKTGVVG